MTRMDYHVQLVLGPAKQDFTVVRPQTSPRQSSCAPLGDDHPENYYCLQGVGRQMVGPGRWSTPETTDPRFRSGVAECNPQKEHCANGKRTKLFAFDSCKDENGEQRVLVANSDDKSWAKRISGVTDATKLHFSMYEKHVGTDIPGSDIPFMGSN